MACVTVTNVTVLDNPARFENPFQHEIEFECIAPIPDGIEWKLTYVGSAESDDYDQLLDSVDCRVSPVWVCDYVTELLKRSHILERTLSPTTSTQPSKRQRLVDVATDGQSDVALAPPTPGPLRQAALHRLGQLHPPSSSTVAPAAFAAAAAAASGLATAAPTGCKRALVVGIDYTGSPKHKLRCAVKDAQDVCDKLQRMGFDVVLVREADIGTFRQAVRTFCDSLQPQDVAFFYFAGHGVEAEVCVGGHMVPSNWLIGKELPAENDDLPHKAIDAFKMLSQMEAKQTLFNVIILDCCRDDPLPAYKLGAGQGLRRMEPKTSLVVFACEPGKRSAERPQAANGVFAKHLLHHIETPDLCVEDLFKRVRNDVNEETKNFKHGMQDPCCFYAIKVENAMLRAQ